MLFAPIFSAKISFRVSLDGMHTASTTVGDNGANHDTVVMRKNPVTRRILRRPLIIVPLQAFVDAVAQLLCRLIGALYCRCKTPPFSELRT